MVDACTIVYATQCGLCQHVFGAVLPYLVQGEELPTLPIRTNFIQFLAPQSLYM